jgi:predicted murein hydrolase (TIGR00659 family)
MVWDVLLGSPLLSVSLTLCAYLAALWIAKRCNFSPLANPVVISVAFIIVVLKVSGVTYRDYFSGAQLIHFFLGPATVALAIPLARQLPRLQRSFMPMFLSLALGSVTAIISAITITALLKGTLQLAISAGPKSATTPIAMSIAERLGGIPAVTTALVISTGIFGAIIARYLFNWMRIDSPEVRGFALGVAAHGIGTARAYQVSAEIGTFAGLGMGLNGVLTALLAPWLIPFITRFFY